MKVYLSSRPTSVRETRSKPPPPLKRGTVPLMSVLFTLHHGYRKKNQNCKKRQWCLWRFMCPLSLHQFIKISICALKKKKVQTLRCRATRESLCANGSVPCTAAETIARTKLASFVWEQKKSGAFLKHRPCPSCTDVQVDVSMEKKLSEKIQTYLDLMWLFQNRYSFQWRNLSAQYGFNKSDIYTNIRTKDVCLCVCHFYAGHLPIDGSASYFTQS